MKSGIVRSAIQMQFWSPWGVHRWRQNRPNEKTLGHEAHARVPSTQSPEIIMQAFFFSLNITFRMQFVRLKCNKLCEAKCVPLCLVFVLFAVFICSTCSCRSKNGIRSKSTKEIRFMFVWRWLFIVYATVIFRNNLNAESEHQCSDLTQCHEHGGARTDWIWIDGLLWWDSYRVAREFCGNGEIVHMTR